MKNIKFLLGLLTVVIIMASCATTQSAMGDDMDEPRTQQIGNRVYLQDPFYGTVVLERDPYTGRYYDVTYGSRYGMGYGGNPYGGYYRGNRGGGYYGRGRVIQQQQGPSREQIRPNREEARKKILGN
jgi:hypothetical protein